jgi:hypothetical protein
MRLLDADEEKLVFTVSPEVVKNQDQMTQSDSLDVLMGRRKLR